jgi:hypothetical protein
LPVDSDLDGINVRHCGIHTLLKDGLALPKVVRPGG